MDLTELKLEDFSAVTFPSLMEVTFSRKYPVGDYATECIGLKKQFKIPEGVPDVVTNVIMAIEQAQLEYTAYVNLLSKGIITAEKFATRKSELETTIRSLANKSEEMGYPLEATLNSLGLELVRE